MELVNNDILHTIRQKIKLGEEFNPFIVQFDNVNIRGRIEWFQAISMIKRPLGYFIPLRTNHIIRGQLKNERSR